MVLQSTTMSVSACHSCRPAGVSCTTDGGQCIVGSVDSWASLAMCVCVCVQHGPVYGSYSALTAFLWENHPLTELIMCSDDWILWRAYREVSWPSLDTFLPRISVIVYRKKCREVGGGEVTSERLLPLLLVAVARMNGFELFAEVSRLWMECQSTCWLTTPHPRHRTDWQRQRTDYTPPCPLALLIIGWRCLPCTALSLQCSVQPLGPAG